MMAYRALVLYLLTAAMVLGWSMVAVGVARLVGWPTLNYLNPPPSLFIVGVLLGCFTSWQFLPWHKLDSYR